jgi:hypothetical protein
MLLIVNIVSLSSMVTLSSTEISVTLTAVTLYQLFLSTSQRLVFVHEHRCLDHAG